MKIKATIWFQVQNLRSLYIKVTYRVIFLGRLVGISHFIFIIYLYEMLWVYKGMIFWESLPVTYIKEKYFTLMVMCSFVDNFRFACQIISMVVSRHMLHRKLKKAISYCDDGLLIFLCSYLLLYVKKELFFFCISMYVCNITVML